MLRSESSYRHFTSWTADRDIAAYKLHFYPFLRHHVTEPAMPRSQPQAERTSMPGEWERPYRKAFQELDAEKVSELCENARAAINDRLTELAGEIVAGEKERERLFEALRTLFLHEQHRRAPN